MAWIDNIKSWTGLPAEESVRMPEDRDKWRKYVHGVATLGSRTAKASVLDKILYLHAATATFGH